MVIERSSLKTEIKPRMREGKGDVALTHLGGARLQKHLRLLSEIVIPPGSSIGQILPAKQILIIILKARPWNDNGRDRREAGDIVVTGGGASIASRRPRVPLKMIAVIVTDE